MSRASDVTALILTALAWALLLIGSFMTAFHIRTVLFGVGVSIVAAVVAAFGLRNKTPLTYPALYVSLVMPALLILVLLGLRIPVV